MGPGTPWLHVNTPLSLVWKARCWESRTCAPTITTWFVAIAAIVSGAAVSYVKYVTWHSTAVQRASIQNVIFITMAATSGKRDVTVWRPPSVRQSVRPGRYTQWCSSRGRCLAPRLPRGWKLWYLGLMPAASVFHWFASASENSLCLCLYLGLDLTASVSPWLIWLMGKPHKTQILVMGYPTETLDEWCWVTVNHIVWLMWKPRKNSDGYGLAKTNPITWAFAAFPCFNQ